MSSPSALCRSCSLLSSLLPRTFLMLYVFLNHVLTFVPRIIHWLVVFISNKGQLHHQPLKSEDILPVSGIACLQNKRMAEKYPKSTVRLLYFYLYSVVVSRYMSTDFRLFFLTKFQTDVVFENTQKVCMAFALVKNPLISNFHFSAKPLFTMILVNMSHIKLLFNFWIRQCRIYFWCLDIKSGFFPPKK